MYINKSQIYRVHTQKHLSTEQKKKNLTKQSGIQEKEMKVKMLFEKIKT